MLNKIKKMMLTGSKLAEHYEKRKDWDKALEEYVKLGDNAKVGKILDKLKRWHYAAGLFIEKKEVDLARRAVETCFRQDEKWETFKLPGGRTITIEDWLQQNAQVRRFTRYVQNVSELNPQGTPLIVALADRFKKIEEYKSAAELYLKGFHLVNKNPKSSEIKNEEWLREASECYALANLYIDAAKNLKRLMETEVQIGTGMSKNYKYNPYRNYTYHLEFARRLNFLTQLVEILEDFDPFNIAYDLLHIKEIKLSIDLFFKYYGRVVKKDLTEKELEIRNEKVSYCLNQYVIYFREKKNFKRAAKIALLNDQKKIAADLYKLGEEIQEKDDDTASYDVTNLRTEGSSEEASSAAKETKPKPVAHGPNKCPHCSERVEPDWDVCPNCGNVMTLNMCECGESLKPHWNRCPTCGKELN